MKQATVPCVMEVFPSRKQAGCEFDHSLQSSVEVKNEQNYTFTPPVGCHDLDRDKFTFAFIKQRNFR
jgi:hypothetical protein